ncbi:MAG: MFS transporter [Halieaceae bacterium]|nr:MFS transporter [Halieaceae bacterium]
MSDPGRPRLFHGWRIVFCVAVCQFLSIGLYNVYGFFATPIIETFQLTDTSVGIGMSIMLLGATLVSPVLGFALDRHRVKPLMLSGIALMAILGLALTRSTQVWQLMLTAFLLAAAFEMYGMLPANVLIGRWFISKRGLALSLGMMGISVAGFLLPPISAWLVSALEWRNALAVIVLGAAVLAGFFVYFTVVDRPSDLGMNPDGDAIAATGVDSSTEMQQNPLVTKEVLANRNFWVITFCFSIAYAVPTAAFFLVRHMESLGIGTARAAVVISVLSVFILVGKISSGMLSDHLDKKSVGIAGFLIYAGGWIAMANQSEYAWILASTVPMGLGLGSLAPLLPILVGVCFGPQNMGRVLGLRTFLGLPFMLCAAPLAGYLRDRTGDYVSSFYALAAVLLLSAVVLAYLDQEGQSH